MKVDGGIGPDSAGAGAAARDAEEAGYDGVWSAETTHDPFLPLLLAAEHTERRRARHGHRGRVRPQPDDPGQHRPTTCRRYSEGRFILGLGSQIKPHITKRFCMEWSHPAPRMREMILAIRAIWDCWNNGTKLDFRGDFYTHTLMTPFFNPGPNPYGNAKIFLAGVGELMTEVAGEMCDGFLCHGFTTERYLREVTMPALERGRDKAGPHPGRLRDLGPGLRRHRRHRGGDGGVGQGHAPADRVLRLDAGLPRRARAARLGRPADRAQRAVEAGRVGGDGRPHRRRDPRTPSRWSPSPSRSAPELHARYGDVVDRISFYAPYKSDPERWRPVLEPSMKG